MYLVELLLPLHDNQGARFPRAAHEEVKTELTERFGGVTAFLRSPAEGSWQETDAKVVRDDVVVFEVMTDGLDRSWWSSYRAALEARFRQQELVIRAVTIERL